MYGDGAGIGYAVMRNRYKKILRKLFDGVGMSIEELQEKCGLEDKDVSFIKKELGL